MRFRPHAYESLVVSRVPLQMVGEEGNRLGVIPGFKREPTQLFLDVGSWVQRQRLIKALLCFWKVVYEEVVPACGRVS